MKKWIDQIGNLGKAMIEIELVGQGYPVLFVAIIASKRYLVETLDYEEGIYLLSSTTENRLLDMLNGINDIYTSVSEGKKKYYVSYNYEVGEYQAEEIDSGKLSDDMPDKGVFFKINTPTVSEYKQVLAKSISAKSIKKNRAEDNHKW